MTKFTITGGYRYKKEVSLKVLLWQCLYFNKMHYAVAFLRATYLTQDKLDPDCCNSLVDCESLIHMYICKRYVSL